MYGMNSGDTAWVLTLIVLATAWVLVIAVGWLGTCRVEALKTRQKKIAAEAARDQAIQARSNEAIARMNSVEPHQD